MAEKTSARAEKDEAAVAEKIAAMPAADKKIAERLDAAIRAAAPDLAPRLWYGQPAYAKDGKVVVFFRGAEVDKERYLTLGFSSTANLDDGSMWPTAYALTAIDDEVEQQIGALVKRAAS